MMTVEQVLGHPLALAAGSFGLAAVMVILRGIVRREHICPGLSSSLSVLAAGFAAGGFDEFARVAHLTTALPYLDALAYTTLAIGAVHTCLALFVDFYLRQRQGSVVSALFRDVAGIVLDFLVIVIVLRSTLDVNIPSVIATSAVLTAIIGLALQDVLHNLFGGVVLELEAPFSRGEWVRVGVFEGRVLETGWRTTKLLTRVNEIVTLPNSLLSKEAMINYSRPDSLFADTRHFEAGYEVPPNLVRAAALEALDEEPAVARSPRGEIWLERFGESGVGYAVRYWVTDFAELERIRSRVMTNLWYALRRANVRFPFPARDVFFYQGSIDSLVTPERSDVSSLLRAVPLLAPLDDAAMARLSSHARRATYGAGERVVGQGDPGDSFFVIERGEADVLLGNDATGQRVGQLTSGSFFGEMSLLAGERRTATVRAASDLTVLVIDRDAFRDVIQASPTLLGPICEIAAQRQAEQDEYRRALDRVPAGAPSPGAQRLRERIRSIFGI